MTKRICSIHDCANTGKIVRGMCNKHYKRWRNNAEPSEINSRFSNPEDAFAARTEWRSGCLIWTGAKEVANYGYIKVGAQYMRAHRYNWEKHYGRIPDGMHLDHTCYTPECVNVDHLRLATPQQNTYNRSGALKISETGHRNVYRSNGATGTWRVRVTKSGETYHFGTFHNISEAILAAEQARQKLFGEFAGRG